ncbi:sensor histidine kinase [Coraliomargarita akajimensis]|uniref:histidine kinase n=1 Tax=Coraliomargarita akajimensis (strain DSM 45221 / IAM 15411 / JCM 23193 / KCTC 12865 / 04OKA010-24) TaxID=583355 RepID=D5ENS1_CORAD|nr:histidine kinase [Coraliomargarita akajimensis]ADE53580.1 putative signal transduction histidine kinase [Coraliomargarita akajimensis DSM 45221]
MPKSAQLIRDHLASARQWLLAACSVCFAGLPAYGLSLPGKQSEALREEIQAIETQLEALPNTLPSRSQWTRGFSSSWTLQAGETVTLEIDFRDEVHLVDTVVLMPQTYLGDSNQQEVFGFPIRFTIERELVDGSHEVIVDYSKQNYVIEGYEPQCFFIEAPVPTRGLRIQVTQLETAPPWFWKDNTPVVALSEVLAFEGQRNVALNGMVESTSSYEFGTLWAKKSLVDGFFGFAPVNRDLSEPREEYHVYTDELIIDLDLGEAHALDELRFWPVVHHDLPEGSGIAFPMQIAVEAYPGGFSRTSRTLYINRNMPARPSATPFTHRVIDPISTRYVRCIFRGGVRDFRIERDPYIALSEIELLVDGQLVSRDVLATAAYSTETRASQSYDIRKLTDGRTNEGRIIPLRQWIEQSQVRAQLERRRLKLSEQLKLAQSEEQAWARWLITAAISVIIILLLLVYVVRLLGERRLTRMRVDIASDLHDEVGANLSSIAHTTELVSETIERPSETQVRLLHQAIDTARQSARDLRQIVEFLEHRHHMGSVTEQIGKVAQEILVGIPLSFTIKNEQVFDRLDPVQKWNLLLFVKEATNNILKHAEASEVIIVATMQKGRPCITIEDNGIGIPSSEIPPAHLASRAKKLGGQLEVQAFTNHGTTIVLSL